MRKKTKKEKVKLVDEVVQELADMEEVEQWSLINRMDEWVRGGNLQEVADFLDMSGYKVVKVEKNYSIDTISMLEKFLEKLKADPYAKMITVEL